MPPVAKHRQPDSSRPSKIKDSVNCSSHCSPSEENVINDHDGLAGHLKIKVGCVNHRSRWPSGKVIAVQGDVYVAEGN
jgi:hypothetical protein